MYDDWLRMLNSYRPVFHEKSGIIYGFKPYMQGGSLQPLIDENPWRTMDHLRRSIDKAFDTDFWRKPRARFPFTLSLSKALTTRSFWFKVHLKLAKYLGNPSYGFIIDSPEIIDNMAALLDRFTSLARGRGLVPVVAFIPRNRDDTTSGAVLEAALKPIVNEWPVVTQIGDGIDWSRFNLGSGTACHPSAYGYSMIAANVAATLRPMLASHSRHAVAATR
jgi:hypothetical protein